MLIDSILIGMLCGAWSFLWCNVLTMPGMLGNIVPATYWRVMGQHKTWKEQVAKPLFDCAVCNSFWISLSAVLYSGPSYPLAVIVAALFSAYYLNRKYNE